MLIKILVITLTLSVSSPIGIRTPKILPVMRVALIPRVPPRLIPVRGSDNIGGRIGVIRGPAVLRAEKVIQEAIQKPVSVVIDPGRIRPDPRLSVRIPGRRWIMIGLGIRRDRHGSDCASR